MLLLLLSPEAVAARVGEGGIKGHDECSTRE